MSLSRRRSEAQLALMVLTRLPAGRIEGDPPAVGDTAWAFPLVGILVGAISGGVFAVAGWLGLHGLAAALLAIGAAVLATGGLHEDGLADCADGFWGGWDVKRRLEIMKDSRIGVYGVCAIGLTLLLRWAALTTIVEMGGYWAALIAVGATSRATMVVLMATMPNARGTGLSKSVGQPSANTMWAAVGIAAVFAVILGLPEILLIAAAVTLACGLIARAKIGGQTGDILGGTQQINEVILLAAVVVSIS